MVPDRMAAFALSPNAAQDNVTIAAARLTPKDIFMAISYSVSACVLLTMSVDYIGAVSKKQARNAGLFESGRETRQAGSNQRQ
jgi:Sec-independent protein secretion pathway component TatC